MRNVMALALWVSIGSAVSVQAAGLKILVIQGEDAVNIIQQKTAVAPIVEVRDQNSLPVSGSSVSFTLGGGRTATFANGARTVTVTTDSTGRATVTTLNPINSGRVQIQVRASFHGESATATITQTNVLTAAAAGAAGAAAGVAAGGAAAGGGGAGAGAAGGAAAAGGGAGGGGLSAVTIGAIVAGAGGGTLLAVEAAKGNLLGGGGDKAKTYSGSFTGQFVVTTVSFGPPSNIPLTCVSTRMISATLTLKLEETGGSITGDGQTTGTVVETSVTATPNCTSPVGSPFSHRGALSGTTSNFGFTEQTSSTGTGVTDVLTTSFTGALTGDVINGTLAHSEMKSGVSTTNTTVNGSGSASFPVTLTRQ